MFGMINLLAACVLLLWVLWVLWVFFVGPRHNEPDGFLKFLCILTGITLILLILSWRTYSVLSSGSIVAQSRYAPEVKEIRTHRLSGIVYIVDKRRAKETFWARCYFTGDFTTFEFEKAHQGVNYVGVEFTMTDRAEIHFVAPKPGVYSGGIMCVAAGGQKWPEEVPRWLVPPPPKYTITFNLDGGTGFPQACSKHKLSRE